MSNITQGNSIFGRGLPQYLEKPGAFRVEHGHILAEGRDWHDALLPEYWSGCAKLLNAGDRIVVHSADHQVQFNIIALSSNPIAQLPVLDFGFAPIWPLDLKLPASSGSRRHRPWFDQARNWRTVRDPRVEICLTELLDRDAALKACASLDQAAATAAPTVEAPSTDGAAARAAELAALGRAPSARGA
jgi:hypothetical protein